MWHSKEWTAGNKDIILESVENGLLTIKWIVIENNVSCDKKKCSYCSGNQHPKIRLPRGVLYF
jgi:hypothetical protein